MTTILTLHALKHHATRATYRRDQRGQAVRSPPAGYCMQPTAELVMTEREPISMSGASIFSMSPNQAIPTDKLIRFFPLAAAQPSTILSWPEALNASGFRRACRMGISRNACSLLIRTQLAESVLELQLPRHIVQKPVDLGDEILWDRGLPTQLDPYLNLQVVSHRRCADLTDLVGKILDLFGLR